MKVSGAAVRRRWVVVLAGALAAAALTVPSQPPTAAASTTQSGPPAAEHPSAADPRAACRTWQNEWQPPPRVRVYRTRGPAAGTVQSVDFGRYVAVVMAAEWPASMPRETLRAGAVAVKQYAWYYSLYYRGWLAPDGNCFHVMDTSIDQVYWPELRVPHLRHQQAIAATWKLSLRRTIARTGSNRLILTSYRQGLKVACGSDADGLKLFQLSARACGHRGLTAKQILRTYYGSTLELVDVRQHDILADSGWRGDAAVLAGKPGAGRTQWRVYAATASGFRPPASGSLKLDPGQILDAASADVTGDGLSDLVLLVRVKQRQRQLIVLRASGSGYGAARLWARWREDDADDARQLLLADFNGDGLADAGVLRAVRDRRTSYRQAALLVMPALAGGGFAAQHEAWRGGFDPAVNRALTADLNGDGRADLLVSQDRGRNGLRLWVMPSRLLGGTLGTPRLWLERRDWQAAATRLVAIDENRDGRDDIFVVRPRGSTAISVHALRARPSGGFAVTLRWQTPSGRHMPFADVKPAALHVDADGRGDLVIFQRLSSGKTQLFWLRTTNPSLLPGRILLDGTLAWSRSRPY